MLKDIIKKQKVKVACERHGLSDNLRVYTSLLFAYEMNLKNADDFYAPVGDFKRIKEVSRIWGESAVRSGYRSDKLKEILRIFNDEGYRNLHCQNFCDKIKPTFDGIRKRDIIYSLIGLNNGQY